MRQLPEAMYEIHEALVDYVSVHNAVFKKFSLAAIFKPIPFDQRAMILDSVITRIHGAELALKEEDALPQVFLDYAAALRNTAQQLQMICANLHLKAQDPGRYKYATYNQDVAVYHAMETRYQALGNHVNKLITSK